MDIPKFAIVVGRQYGAGARRMAAELARRLGAAYYDKELLDEAARRLGYHLSLFSAADERRPSMLRGMWLHGFGMGGGTDALSGETLFQVQADVLRDIAEHGNCVIEAVPQTMYCVIIRSWSAYSYMLRHNIAPPIL
ncbi:MAG: cytidylate kinase-like family protein [Muribaculaceae bacterium]|nr:cytidylate kinase-like family protein [Muribaculaceae bacterium]